MTKYRYLWFCKLKGEAEKCGEDTLEIQVEQLVYLGLKNNVMTDIVFKYSLLNSSAKKQVNDFLDFLLQQQRGKGGNSLSSYKKKILGVTTWSDSDIEVFQINQKLFNSSWRPEKW